MSLVLTTLFLLSGSRETEAVQETGSVGHDITITCSHSYADTNVKYFCRGGCSYEDVLITSKETDSNGKYRIKDEGNTVLVTVSDLKQEDAGTYWCGIDRVGVDTYIKVTLSVKDNENLQGSVKSFGPQKLVFLGAGLSGVLLVLVTLVLLFFRFRKRHIRTSSGEDEEFKNAAPFTRTTDPEPDQGRLEKTYSNVSSEPQIQPVDLLYSTISFSKQADCSSVTSQTESTTYSSIKYKPTSSSDA